MGGLIKTIESYIFFVGENAKTSLCCKNMPRGFNSSL